MDNSANSEKNKKENILFRRPIIFLFLILTGVFLYPIFFGKVFFPGDLLYQLPPWSLNSARVLRDVLPINNPLLGDPVTAFYPWYTFISNSISAGYFPLWNPLVMGGAPLLANWQSGALALQNIIFYIIKSPLALNIQIFLKVFLALSFTYLFLRKLRLSKEAAVFGAVTYTFSAFFIVWLNWPQTRTAIWLPLVLFTVEHFFEKSGFKQAGFISLALGAAVLSGHPGTLIQVLLIFITYSAYKLIINKEERLKKLSYLLASSILGVGLGAALVLPGYEMMKNSFQYGQRGAADYLDLSLSYGNIGLIFFPKFYGHLKDGIYLGPANFNEVSVYVGLLPLFFVFWALTYIKKYKRMWPFLFYIFLTLPLIYSFWPQSLIYKLPLISMQPTQRYIFILTFALAVVGAFGFEAFFKENRRAVRLAVLGFIFTLAMIIIFRKLPPAVWGIYKEYYVFMFLPFLFLFGVFLTKGKDRYKWVLIFVLVFDLFLFGINLNSYIKSEYIYPKNAVTDFINKDKSIKRVLPLVDTMLPNSLMPYGITDLRGRDALIENRSKRFYSLLSEREGIMQLPNFVLPDKIGSPLIDFLNVKYLISEISVGNSMPRSLIKSNSFAEVYKSESHSQDFVSTKDNLSGIGFLVGTFRRAYNPTSLSFKVYDEKHKLVRSTKVNAAYFRDNSYYSVSFKAIPDSKNKKYTFILEGKDVPKKYRTAIYLSTYDQYAGGAHYAGGKKQPGDLVFYLQYHKELKKYKEVFRYKSLKVYENKDVFDRAYAVTDFEVVKDAAKALKKLENGKVDLKKQVLLQDNPVYGGKPTAYTGEKEVKIVSYKPNSIDILAKLDKRSIIVVTDNFYPGWNAYIDGKKAPVNLANTSFRAVALNKGKHLLELKYQPASFRNGLLASIGSLLLVLGFIFGPALVERFSGKEKD